MDELKAKHRAEKRDLQNKITSKKKNATKKTRKGVNDECDTLERELKEKHQREIDDLQGNDVEQGVADLEINGDGHSGLVDSQVEIDKDDLTADPKQVRFDASAKTEEVASEQFQRGKKPNRQKARLARRAAEQEAQADAAAEEALNLPDLREQEMNTMKQHQQKLGLVETFIQPDGHCLYAACAHGMPSEKVRASGTYSIPYQNVRLRTAAFISKHPDDFSAFLEEPLDSYVRKIKDTAEWGGQLELQAIARAYNVNINVLQASGRVEKIEPEKADAETTELWLAYYKHSFGLGEHYNALNKSK